ncbi:hypothetical protein OK074_3880, partial [Actinobacteria bacterium OK074]
MIGRRRTGESRTGVSRTPTEGARVGADSGRTAGRTRCSARRRPVRRGFAAVVLTAVLAVVGGVLWPAVLLAGPAAAADDPGAYAFAATDKSVAGATGTINAVRLTAGQTYKSAVSKDGKVYYRLELDAIDNAYVSVTAVPRKGTTVSAIDGIRVSVQDSGGFTCSPGSTTYFAAGGSPHPIAAWAAREITPSAYRCQQAGPYYVVVERRDNSSTTSGTGGTSGTGSSQGQGTTASSAPWDLEIDYVSEPALKKAGPTTAPETWNSATPEPVLGGAARRTGGAGFATARALGQGVWQDSLVPGRTLFYRVPVDWGQQLYATAELGSSATDGDGFVGSALTMALYDPVRGFVEDADSAYGGEQSSATLQPLPPVAYDNRNAVSDRSSAMRFAGWYYLAVHLSAPVADKFGEGPFGLTLRVRVAGTAKSAPAYAGESQPDGVFEVTAQDRAAAAGGATPGGGSGGSGGSDETSGTSGSGATTDSESGSAGTSGGGDSVHELAMRVVAVGGIGTGSALVLGLALWTAAARVRARWRGWR